VDKRLAPEKRIGLALRAKREEAGFSQEGLSFESGLHRTYIGAVERGEKNITLRNIIRVANALNTKTSELLKMADL
jgi:transcriptional regulator with XRE-family HTH domain